MPNFYKLAAIFGSPNLLHFSRGWFLVWGIFIRAAPKKVRCICPLS